MTPGEVRCSGCSRLLAERREDGALEIRYRDKYRVVIVSGAVECLRCNFEITVASNDRVRAALAV